MVSNFLNLINRSKICVWFFKAVKTARKRVFYVIPVKPQNSSKSYRWTSKWSILKQGDVWLKKFYWDQIEHIWVSLWNFFLSSIGLAGIDIPEENSKYFEKVVFGKFFQFEKQLKNVFFVNTYVFRRGYRSLWVCYRYGRYSEGKKKTIWFLFALISWVFIRLTSYL